jgi:6-phosphogluconolactonase (cycloisomerase 2 family)
MKKLISILVLAPVLAMADGFLHDVVTPLRINGGDGNNVEIKIVAPTQNVPYIAINNGTNTIYAVNQDGSVFSAATTNQLTFGATNSAPANGSNVVNWVSVRVVGDTNTYRLPLYK